jgi:hypothetical protein
MATLLRGLVAVEPRDASLVRATEEQCQLLGQWGSFGWWLQGFLGLACFIALVYKRFTDSVRRPWKIWLMDTSKQGIAAIMMHFLNIGLSKAYGELLDTAADPCNWYWVNFTLDCTLGVAIVCGLLRAQKWCYRRAGCEELANVGDYGDPPSWRIWRRQLFDYQLLVVISKILLGTVAFHYRDLLSNTAGRILGPLDDHPRAKLIVVMVVTPMMLNVLALWVADNYLISANQVTEKGTKATSESEEDSGLISFEEWKSKDSEKKKTKSQKSIKTGVQKLAPQVAGFPRIFSQVRPC